MFGSRDPHLRSEQPVGAVVLGFGAGEDIGQRRARLGLRQRHRAGEPAGQHRLQKRLDQLGCAEPGQQVGIGHGEHQIAGGAHVGRREPCEAGLGHGDGQLRAAQSLIHRHCEQIGLGEGVPRLLHLGNDRDLFAVEGRLVGVARFVVRREVATRELLAQVEYRVERLARMLGESLSVRQLVNA